MMPEKKALSLQFRAIKEIRLPKRQIVKSIGINTFLQSGGSKI